MLFVKVDQQIITVKTKKRRESEGERDRQIDGHSLAFCVDKKNQQRIEEMKSLS